MILPQSDPISCPHCGYDLRSSPGERCSECGTIIESDASLKVPWELSAGIFATSRFWHTALLATVFPRRLAASIATEPNRSAARAFRRIVLGIVTCCVTTLFILVVWHEAGTTFLVSVPLPGESMKTLGGLIKQIGVFWSAGAIVAPVLPIGFFVTCWLATRFKHFFALRGLGVQQQMRSMALSNYLSAQLLILLLPACAAAYMIFSRLLLPEFPTDLGRLDIPAFFAWIILLGIIVSMPLIPTRFAMALPAGNAGRFGAIFLGSSLQWITAIVLGLFAFPAFVGMIWIMIDSLR